MFFVFLIGNILFWAFLVLNDVCRHSFYFFGKLKMLIEVWKNEKKLKFFLLTHNGIVYYIKALIIVLSLLFAILFSVVFVFRVGLYSEYVHTKQFSEKKVAVDVYGNMRIVNELFSLRKRMKELEGDKIEIEVSKVEKRDGRHYVVNMGGRELRVFSEYDHYLKKQPSCITGGKGEMMKISGWVHHVEYDVYYIDCYMDEHHFQAVAVVSFDILFLYFFLFLGIYCTYKFNICKYLRWNQLRKLMKVIRPDGNFGRGRAVDYLRCALDCSSQLEEEFENAIYEDDNFIVCENWMSYKGELCFIGNEARLSLHTVGRHYSVDEDDEEIGQPRRYLLLIREAKTNTCISWIQEPIDLLDEQSELIVAICRVSSSFRNMVDRVRYLADPNNIEVSEHRRRSEYLSVLMTMIQAQTEQNRQMDLAEVHEARENEMKRLVAEISADVMNDEDEEDSVLKMECRICSEDEPKIHISFGCCKYGICVDCVVQLRANTCPFCRREISFESMAIMQKDPEDEDMRKDVGEDEKEEVDDSKIDGKEQNQGDDDEEKGDAKDYENLEGGSSDSADSEDENDWSLLGDGYDENLEEEEIREDDSGDSGTEDDSSDSDTEDERRHLGDRYSLQSNENLEGKGQGDSNDDSEDFSLE